jgi:hypothetical protein
MDNIVDLIATNGTPADISDAIKNALFAKASEKVDGIRPTVALSMFGGDNNTGDEE